MSFYASNDLIRVTDGLAEVFSTDTPMPHIVQAITGNAVVTFPNPGGTTYINGQTTQGVFRNEQVCDNVYVCKPVQVCGIEQVCIGGTCTPQYVCHTETQCGFEYQCSMQQVPHTEYTIYGGRRVNALEWETVIELGTVPAGCDFVLVNANGTRTVAGSQNDYGTFISAVPAGDFIAQGSGILESAFAPQGASWLRRIMSVYIEGDKLKVKFKHSNRQYDSYTKVSSASRDDFPPASVGSAGVDAASSVFNMNFNCLIGRFTK